MHFCVKNLCSHFESNSNILRGAPISPVLCIIEMWGPNKTQQNTRDLSRGHRPQRLTTKKTTNQPTNQIHDSKGQSGRNEAF